MRLYEAMVVIRPELDDEATAALVQRLTDTLGAAGAAISGVDRWGKRRLAYEINHCREGQYFLFTFSGEAAAARDLGHVCKINESVLRHLVVMKTTPLAAPAVAEAPAETAPAAPPAPAQPAPAETAVAEETSATPEIVEAEPAAEAEATATPSPAEPGR